MLWILLPSYRFPSLFACPQLKWIQHLDLTTDATQFRAYIYASPTVIDLDGDGRLEIIVGTSVGFIYCLNADGKLLLKQQIWR